jgi:hypothetical protein
MEIDFELCHQDNNINLGHKNKALIMPSKEGSYKFFQRG